MQLSSLFVPTADIDRRKQMLVWYGQTSRSD
jgi:hypothetical protein